MEVFRYFLLSLLLSFQLGAQPTNANSINLWRGYLTTNTYYEILEFSKGSETVLSGYLISNSGIFQLSNCNFNYTSNVFTATVLNNKPIRILYKDHEYLKETELFSFDDIYKREILFVRITNYACPPIPSATYGSRNSF